MSAVARCTIITLIWKVRAQAYISPFYLSPATLLLLARFLVKDMKNSFVILDPNVN